MNKKLQNLIDVLLDIKTEKEMREFLFGVLTPQELQELPRRLEIVRLLKQGVAQHKIAERLGTGVATVTRGSREIQKGRFRDINIGAIR